MRTAAAAALMALAMAAGGCGRAAGPKADPGGSTLHSSYNDANGDGQLQVGPGEPLRDRTRLGRKQPITGEIARFAQLTDAHVRDEESPARAPFLDRLGEPFTSVFRPQESLTTQVLVAAVKSIDAFHPRQVIEGGDLADSTQRNEFAAGAAALNGGQVDPDSGSRGYQGVQAASDPDPFYYRPGVDSPRYRGLLADAQRRFRSPGLDAPWFPVTGNHDVLVDGEVGPTAATRALAVGDRAIQSLPSGLHVPRNAAQARVVLDQLLASDALKGGRKVTSDAARAELGEGAIAYLRRASHLAGDGPRLDYTVDLGPRVLGVVLDTVRRDAGSGGVVTPGELTFLTDALHRAGKRWVVVFSHQPLAGDAGAGPALALLDADPYVLATVAGHTHRNQITARPTRAGGYWQIVTASLADFPQQARAIRILSTRGGGAVIETWMLDTAPARLPDIARQLSYLDAQGGRPDDARGTRLDRNVRLWRAPPQTPKSRG